MGFITARCFRLHECDPTDRAAMGLQSRLLDAYEVSLALPAWRLICPAGGCCDTQDSVGHSHATDDCRWATS